VARRRLVGGRDTMRVDIVAYVSGEPEHHATQIYERER